ncbi:hypothetical protein PLICRDRAFT_39021 [Plicaturopsis crispa FD-325 SS-3]|nr:hypothetical protein PLICRDRAFT_39021 [Plicaturopsis crispa FD-325 SS-3]
MSHRAIFQVGLSRFSLPPLVALRACHLKRAAHLFGLSILLEPNLLIFISGKPAGLSCSSSVDEMGYVRVRRFYLGVLRDPYAVSSQGLPPERQS